MRQALNWMMSVTAGCLLAADAMAGPGGSINPNGFPSGAHFNLNIIGKKADFTPPEQQYDEVTGEPVYGNVIFIPAFNVYPIEIAMESGKKGPKSAPDTATLEVTDCSSGFTANDQARLRLPKNDKGYNVYGRILAKPTSEPTISITPGLSYAIDEQGHELIQLGMVTDSGFATMGSEFTRQKGKSTAVDISGLFQWNGTVCYFTNPDPSDLSIYTKPVWAADFDADGVYDDILQPAEDGSLPPEGYVEIIVYCKDYTNEWVFNIADFVEYLWGMDNNGSKLLQIRFYPIQ